MEKFNVKAEEFSSMSMRQHATLLFKLCIFTGTGSIIINKYN